MLRSIAAIGWPVVDRFRIGRFAVSPHGIGIAIGFLTGAWLIGRIGPRRGLDPDHLSTLVFWSLIGAIIGSRLFYVIAHYSEFANFGQMLAIWRGGISLLGGIAGAILINVPRVRGYGYRLFQVLDPFAICLALGIAIGRIGDLIIGDHLGKPTSWLLAWQYKGGSLAPPFTCLNGICQAALQAGHLETIQRKGARLLDAKGAVIATGVGIHQTALYDMLLAWVLFALLWTLNSKPRREGILALTFGLYYGLCRVLEDSLRIDKRFGPFTGSQWTALTVAVLSAVILIWWAFHPNEEAPASDTGSPDDGSAPVEPVPGEPGENTGGAVETVSGDGADAGDPGG